MIFDESDAVHKLSSISGLISSWQEKRESCTSHKDIRSSFLSAPRIYKGHENPKTRMDLTYCKACCEAVFRFSGRKRDSYTYRRWPLVLRTRSSAFVSPPRHRWTSVKALQKTAWRAQCASSCPCVSFIIASAPLSERHRARVSTQTVLVEIAEQRDERGHYGPHGHKHKRCSPQQWPLVSPPCDTLHPIQKSPRFCFFFPNHPLMLTVIRES